MNNSSTIRSEGRSVVNMVVDGGPLFSSEMESRSSMQRVAKPIRMHFEKEFHCCSSYYNGGGAARRSKMLLGSGQPEEKGRRAGFDHRLDPFLYGN